MKKILFSLLMLCSMTAAWAEGTGDGSKEHPYSGEWSIPELYDRVKKGDHLALDCDIKGDGHITIYDVRLDQMVAPLWEAWTPGDLIRAATLEGYYKQYGKDNPHDNRLGQTFIVTDKCPDDHATVPGYMIKGYYSGIYTNCDADGYVCVESAEQMMIILRGNSNVTANTSAKIRLTQDIYLSDNKSDDTFCSTFCGTLDGDGHTIYGSKDGTRQNRNYLFTYSEGATFKNLTFKHIRKNSEDHYNQAIITSQAKNGCVFENITFENVGTWTNYDNAGSAAGKAENCSFTNITVKNSDFTTDQHQAGCVVGLALNCSFENIMVEHCESTSHSDKSGGVAGHADDCTINNVKIFGTFIKVSGEYGGGIVGYSTSSSYRNCIIDDQSCVCVDGSRYQYHTDATGGGILGYGGGCEIYNCINSALIAADGQYAGGIVGKISYSGVIDGCLNTGMVSSMKMNDVKEYLYNNYKNITGDMTSVTKTYQGKEYIIRKCGKYAGYSYFGGIAGYLNYGGTISKCVNLGSVESFGEKVAGISGGLHGGTISDCLSDCYCGKNEDYFKGISGDLSNATIKNCLNMTTYKDHVDSYSGGNNYSLTTATGVEHITKTTAAKVKSGEICNLLGEAWEQNIGTDSYPMPTGNKGLYHTRKVSNQYGTVCLPFVVKSDDKISYYSLNRKEEDGEGIKLVFTYNEDKILEGTPLLFRSAEAKDADADNPVEICFNNAGEEFTTIPRNKILDAGFWDLWGTFEQRVFDGDLANHIYYVSGGEIRNAKKTTIAPYRAWIYGESIDDLTGNGTSQVKAIQFVIEDEDGTTTSITPAELDSLPREGWGGVSFTLMGTKAPANYRGIVIKNGKKLLKK